MAKLFSEMNVDVYVPKKRSFVVNLINCNGELRCKNGIVVAIRRHHHHVECLKCIFNITSNVPPSVELISRK